MLATRKNILIICLSLVVAFAPVPALVANAAVNKDAPCTMNMEMVHIKGDVAKEQSQILQSKTQKSASSEHCNNCDQDNHTCQQCDCSLLGCAFSKVQHYSGSAIFPRFTANHPELIHYSNHPPHSRLAPPLLRPPIQLHS